MLQALYEYGLAHRSEFPQEGYAERAIHFIVSFGAGGDFLGVRQSDVKKIVAPYIPGLTSGPKANVLMEKAEVAVCLDSGKEGRKLKTLQEKQKCFLGYFRDGAATVPAFGIVSKALLDAKTLENIQSAVVSAGGKPENVIAFSIDGVLLSDMPEISAWWRAFNASSSSGTGIYAIDVVTGEVCEPVRLFKQLPVEAAGGGQSSGVSLISFNEDAFCSYGAKQGTNAPMSEDTASVIMDAVTYLGKKGIRFSNMRVLHWYESENTSNQDVQLDVPDVLLELFSGVSAPEAEQNDDKAKELGKEARANKLLKSAFTGNLPPNTRDTYHVIVMKPDAARVSVRHYGTGTYEQLYKALESWFDDMRLVTMDGKGVTRNRGLGYLIESLSPVQSGKNKSDAVGDLFQPMLSASMGCREIPMHAVSLALCRIRSMSCDGFSDRSRTVPFQVLKLYLNRRENIKQEEKLMEELNPTLQNVGYQCGRLLAVYEDLQRLATGGGDMLSRYYSGCSQRPAFVLGRLQQLASYYTDKLRSGWYKDHYASLLSGIYQEIHGEIPKVLSVPDQAYFALGYWQQVAAMKQEKEEYKANKKVNETTEEEK